MKKPNSIRSSKPKPINEKCLKMKYLLRASVVIWRLICINICNKYSSTRRYRFFVYYINYVCAPQSELYVRVWEREWGLRVPVTCNPESQDQIYGKIFFPRARAEVIFYFYIIFICKIKSQIITQIYIKLRTNY